jgi:hypothetical protein
VNIWPLVYFFPPLTIVSILIYLQSMTSSYVWYYNFLKFMPESSSFSHRTTFHLAVMHE